MGNILDRIVADKRIEVEQAKKREPLESIERRALDADPPRDFHAAVTTPTDRGIHLIAEIKRRSPSAGLIRKDFAPPAIARVYHEAGASAISVLTDGPYFDGKLEYIRQVREVVPLPILRKDFVVDAYQIWQARTAGADAVLLIAEVLDAKQVADLAALTANLNMTALVEAYHADCLQQVLIALGKPLPPNVLIGVNNRDLAAQRTDISTTAKLATLLEDTSVLVSESGIHTRHDVLAIQRAGAKAMLVGETIMAAQDMAAKIRELTGQDK